MRKTTLEIANNIFLLLSMQVITYTKHLLLYCVFVYFVTVYQYTPYNDQYDIILP